MMAAGGLQALTSRSGPAAAAAAGAAHLVPGHRPLRRPDREGEDLGGCRVHGAVLARHALPGEEAGEGVRLGAAHTADVELRGRKRRAGGVVVSQGLLL
jgi:hypothetical protein